MDSFISKIKRRYYEAYGDLEKENSFLKKLTLGFVLILLLEMTFIFYLGKKEPVVIWADEAGYQVITNLVSHNEPREFEIVNFAKQFTKHYTAYNSYTVSKDLEEAFNHMTASFQKKAERELVASGLIQKIEAAKIDTEIEFKEEYLDRNSKNASVVSLVGVRKITRYGSPEREQILFRADLVLKKVQRSRDLPEGLLIQEYRETILNQVNERR